MNLKSIALFSMLLLSPVCFAQLQQGDYLAITGDSITEQKLYSVFIEDYLLMCRPELKVQATQFGWGGETAIGFFNRVNNDCLTFKPTAVTTFFGMNDGGYTTINETKSNQYRDATRSLIEAFKNAGVRFIVIGSPGVVDSHYFKFSFGQPPAKAEQYNKTLAHLAEIAKKVAEDEKVTYAPVNETMMEVMTKAKAALGEDYEFAGHDGVHPNSNGHLVTAYAFLKALGCDGNIGTITIDAGANKATATEGHTIISSSAQGYEIESTRYPFCFKAADPKDSPAADTRKIIKYFPFNEDLNRLTLIVQNAPAEKMKVTWSSQTLKKPASTIFTREQLEKGINLADEFLDNPFSASFAKVDKAIRDQQNWETPAVKSLLHSIPEHRNILPEQNASFDAIVQGTLAKDHALREASAKAMMPVKHTITLEPVNEPVK